METVEQKIDTTQYIQTAYSLARRLAKEAYWSSDERCNWQGAAIDVVKGQYQIVNKSFRSDLYNGLSGIALFLAEMTPRVNDPIIKETLDATLNSIQKQEESKPLPNHFGVFSGTLGVGFAWWKIGMVLQKDEWKQQGVKYILKLKDVDIQDTEIDVISGVAGAIPVLLKIYQEQNNKELLMIAQKCADFLLSKAQKGTTSWSWVTLPNNPGLTGYSHGAAGIAIAFLELFEVTKDKKYQEAALKSFQYEREHFVPQQQNWPDLRTNMTSNTSNDHVCGEMWCHGAPGIALSRLRAYELTQDESFLNEAHVALQTTYRSVAKAMQTPSTSNFSLCHGLAGNASILHTAGLKLKNEQYIALARQVGNLGIALYENTNTDWPSGVNDPTGRSAEMPPTPGLMLGYAGTGHFYLQLALPQEIENILLIH